MKKIIITSLTSLTAILMIPVALSAAASNITTNTSENGILIAIKNLAAEVQALALAQTKVHNNETYQTDQNLTVAQSANAQSRATTALSSTQTATRTENQLASTLSQFPEQIVNPSVLANKALALKIQQRNALLANLTTHIPASDTLYLDDTTDPLAALYGVAKPSVLHDNDFNFNSVITPNAYTAQQQTAADNYFKYVTQQYQDITSGVNFNQLKLKLNNMSPADKAQALENFVNDPSYQQYQLAVRSALAKKSILLSNLNSLIAERTPVAGLGAEAGLPNDPNLPAGYASPLQVQNYIANERVNNQAWYQKMATASPATVSREQLFILAEIESNLQRNQLLQERILATLSMIALEKNPAIDQGVDNVNTAIDAVGQATSTLQINGG